MQSLEIERVEDALLTTSVQHTVGTNSLGVTLHKSVKHTALHLLSARI